MIESVDPNEKGGGEKEKRSSNSKTPVLDNFSQRPLINLASEGKLDPVVGREEKLKELLKFFLVERKNNPIIIGEPGCGKTAIVEGFSYENF